MYCGKERKKKGEIDSVHKMYKKNLNKQNEDKIVIKLVKFNPTTYSNTDEIANQFNDFYKGSACKILSNLSSPKKSQ